jgi:hypothetical protein
VTKLTAGGLVAGAATSSLSLEKNAEGNLHDREGFVTASPHMGSKQDCTIRGQVAAKRG